MARREHSARELQQKLIHKGHDAAIVVEVLSVLSRQQLVSDRRYTEALLAARRQRGYGPLHIRRELEEKGIDAELISAYVAIQDEAWLMQVEAVRRKKFGAELPAQPAERQKQWRFLQYRGFTSEQIQRVLNARGRD